MPYTPPTEDELKRLAASMPGITPAGVPPEMPVPNAPPPVHPPTPPTNAPNPNASNPVDPGLPVPAPDAQPPAAPAFQTTYSPGGITPVGKSLLAEQPGIIAATEEAAQSKGREQESEAKESDTNLADLQSAHEEATELRDRAETQQQMKLQAFAELQDNIAQQAKDNADLSIPDRERFWSGDNGGFNKVFAGIGTMLMGLAAGPAGVEQAHRILQNHIDNDVKQQERDLAMAQRSGKAKQVELEAQIKKWGSFETADKEIRASHWDDVATMFEKNGLSARSVQVRERATQFAAMAKAEAAKMRTQHIQDVQQQTIRPSGGTSLTSTGYAALMQRGYTSEQIAAAMKQGGPAALSAMMSMPKPVPDLTPEQKLAAKGQEETRATERRKDEEKHANLDLMVDKIDEMLDTANPKTGEIPGISPGARWVDKFTEPLSESLHEKVLSAVERNNMSTAGTLPTHYIKYISGDDPGKVPPELMLAAAKEIKKKTKTPEGLRELRDELNRTRIKNYSRIYGTTESDAISAVEKHRAEIQAAKQAQAQREDAARKAAK